MLSVALAVAVSGCAITAGPDGSAGNIDGLRFVHLESEVAGLKASAQGRFKKLEKQIAKANAKANSNRKAISGNRQAINKNIKALDKLQKQANKLYRRVRKALLRSHNAREISRHSNPGLVSLDFYGDSVFKYDSSVLGKGGMEKLDVVAANIKSGKYVPQKIVGYADMSGDSNYNLRLSLLRAREARKYLSSVGVDISDVEVEGLGEVDRSGVPADSRGFSLISLIIKVGATP